MPDATPTTMAERGLTITRVLDAPRELVWRCWTDPDHFARWWGPEHFHTPRDTVEIDPRPGGVFRATMVGSDGTEHPANGTFREVSPPKRFVFVEEDIDHPMMESQVTVVTLTDLGDARTELRIDVTMRCVEELIPLAESGWGTALDKLAAVVTEG